MDKCMNAVPVIKVELIKKKAFSSSAPHPKLFLKKLVAECEKLTSEVVVSVESRMLLPGLINVEDMITWHLKSNTRELAIILSERESDKRELEKVRHKIRAAKRDLGIKND
ncbi:hypothetical protein EW146_g3154 [Bondarzewia mesenterica]|uniref:Uncharacterized protein n=1 Tax=Bondarzewia mesenterica TaxID=1095465 RepID=A0A4S4M0Q7_9AGAM|nr:hypothetical protein EW146_g3154 [Bondarzewia mesenterica]